MRKLYVYADFDWLKEIELMENWAMNLFVAQITIVLLLASNGWGSTEICFWVMT